MENNFDQQVKIFHQEIVELVKKYQFRDRNQMCSGDLSVSQCYVLEALHRYGPLTMNQLAEKMHLAISTITRVVEHLVRKKYVTKEEDKNDRRFRFIKLTPAGKKIFLQSWQNVLQSEREILQNFPPENRKVLIEFLSRLNQAVARWQACCR